MQASIEKCKNEIPNLINTFQEKPVKKLSRHAHYNKKQKLEKEQNSALLMDYNVSRPILPLITSDIIFDPNWLMMEEPVIRRGVHRHLRSKWIDLKYAVDFQNNKSQDILKTTSYISQKEKAHLIISAWGNLCSFKKLVKLRHLTVSEYVTDIEEHFGVYTRNNLLLFTSLNIASSHNTAYQECINTLLRNLGSLSTSVKEFVQKFYRNLYKKLENDYHWDEHDEPNSLCCLVTLGEFERRELCFPQLQIIIPLQPGQADGIEKNTDRHDVLFIKHQNLNNAQGLNS
ncbi:20332_t:CDS:2 [Racocetra persica]|uniref:20332_t:CDS:1 n=1 Tax=Racocetra persica TaxID=160502 RepID=A0ACA9KEI1_9GLOM|nr:20332_t:CDS:2 [Racocetra persica]